MPHRLGPISFDPALLAERVAAWQGLDEATLLTQLKGGAEDVDDFVRETTGRMARQYNRSMKGVLADMYKDSDEAPPRFRLQAKWKQKEFERNAKAMQRSLKRTLGNEWTRLKDKYPDDSERAGIEYRKVARRKKDELITLIDSSAQMQAEVDQLVHTGGVDPTKAKVMHFTGPLDGKTCSRCATVIAGNPYTVNESTNYGHKLHPNCRHEWQGEWQVDPAEKQVLRRRIADGEIKGWTGTARTPGPVSARAGRDITRGVDWPMPTKDVVRLGRKRGVADEIVDANLNKAQKKRRAKFVASKKRPRKSRPGAWQRGRKGTTKTSNIPFPRLPVQDPVPLNLLPQPSAMAAPPPIAAPAVVEMSPGVVQIGPPAVVPQAATVAKVPFDEWKATLTVEEKDLITWYTGAGYNQVRDYMLDAPMDLAARERVGGQITKLRSAFARVEEYAGEIDEMSGKAELYRGLSHMTAEQVMPLLEVDAEVTLKAFTSATDDWWGAADFAKANAGEHAAVLTFETEHGVPILDLSLHPREREVLLLDQARFQVVETGVFDRAELLDLGYPESIVDEVTIHAVRLREI